MGAGLRGPTSRRIEPAGELAILEISELPRDDRPLPREEEQLRILGQVAHFVGGEERASDMMLAERDSGLFAIERPAHRLKDDGLLAQEVGNHPGAVVIVDAEDLQDAGVGEESAGALAVCGAQLGSSWNPFYDLR